MLNKLRDRVTSFIARNHVCVISTSGSLGAWSALAQYENDCLALNCRLPRWSDVVYYPETLGARTSLGRFAIEPAWAGRLAALEIVNA